jgi:hypothetical protein
MSATGGLLQGDKQHLDCLQLNGAVATTDTSIVDNSNKWGKASLGKQARNTRTLAEK